MEQQISLSSKDSLVAVSLEQLKINMDLEILSFRPALALCVKSGILEILGNHLLLNIQLQKKKRSGNDWTGNIEDSA